LGSPPLINLTPQKPSDSRPPITDLPMNAGEGNGFAAMRRRPHPGEAVVI
jgi:hypothetical protein